MLDQTVLALATTLASALALNWGYLQEHQAASRLPSVSIGRPLRSARLLLASRGWLIGFAAEVAGWGLYVLALALAPLALVQAVSASGIGILAGLVTRFRLTRLRPHERLGVGLSIAGLALLGISLAGGAGEGSAASWLSLGAWLGASAVATSVVVSLGESTLGAGAAYGVAAGIAFAAGDVATKATVAGDVVLAPAMIASYGAGTLLLQTGFQRGSALVTAGLATLLTNSIPIAAGMTIFHEPLPGGLFGFVRVAAFIAVVASAVLLGRRDAAVRAQRERPSADTAPHRPRPWRSFPGRHAPRQSLHGRSLQRSRH